jgi:hypothetical protein
MSRTQMEHHRRNIGGTRGKPQTRQYSATAKICLLLIFHFAYPFS